MLGKTLILLAALVAAGCASDTKHTDLAFDNAPLSVRLGIEKAFPDAKVKEIDKEVYADGVVHYKVELMTKDGEKKDVQFAPDGELLNPK